ncbi:hypothetical protein FLJU110815_13620 [Flavobacterium jumunjinense]
MHDPRVGRFFAVDLLASEYAYNSPYAFSENRLIDGVELEGLEYLPYDQVENLSSPLLKHYHTNGTLANTLETIEVHGKKYYWIGFDINDLEGNKLTTRIDDASFHESEIKDYQKYIKANAIKDPYDGPAPHNGLGYGSQEGNKHDCLTCINRSYDVLLEENIPIYSTDGKGGAHMLDQLKILTTKGFGGERFEYTAKSTMKPSEFVSSKAGDVPGYAFYGVSIKGAYHSVTIVVNNSDPKNPMYNMLDQHGSMLSKKPTDKENAKFVNKWFTATELDAEIDAWGVENTTVIQQIKHKEDE